MYIDGVIKVDGNTMEAKVSFLLTMEHAQILSNGITTRKFLFEHRGFWCVMRIVNCALKKETNA